ncbi:MAG: hypothetical protein K2Y21_10600 [Phycisphaerales bacterium]|nr:hypothetical protein [Phycisphaerales bacterium]
MVDTSRLPQHHQAIASRPQVALWAIPMWALHALAGAVLVGGAATRDIGSFASVLAAMLFFIGLAWWVIVAAPVIVRRRRDSWLALPLWPLALGVALVLLIPFAIAPTKILVGGELTLGVAYLGALLMVFASQHREGETFHCAKCDYPCDRPEETTDLCPECAHTWRQNLRQGRRTPKWPMIYAGLALALAGGLGIFLAVGPLNRAVFRMVPEKMLVRLAIEDTNRMLPSSGLWQTLNGRVLPVAEADQIALAVSRTPRLSAGSEPSQWLSNAIANTLNGVTPGQALGAGAISQILRDRVRVSASLEVSDVAPDDVIVAIGFTEELWGLGLRSNAIIDSIRIGDDPTVFALSREWERFPAQTPPSRGLPVRITGADTYLSDATGRICRIPRATVEGREIKITVRVAFVTNSAIPLITPNATPATKGTPTGYVEETYEVRVTPSP